MTSPDDSLIGRKIGPYTLRARLGGGGMGTVYAAEHELLQQVRALKVMAPHLANHPGFVTLFRREAMLAARLRHPNIVQVHDVGDQDGLHYIVMEHLTGRSLRDAIRTESPVAVERAVSILRQLAEALDFAHDQHVSHRDVKPANIFLDRADRLTLVDFGIARAADGTHLTITSGIGTPEYMAPEAFDDEILGPDADPFVLGVGTDRYALGVVAYELFSGRVPFAGRTPQSVAFAQVHRTPPPVRSRRPELPEAVEPVMQRQLAKDPTARYSGAAAFVQALEEAIRTAPPPAFDTGVPTRPAPGPRGAAAAAGVATTPARPASVAAPSSLSGDGANGVAAVAEPRAGDSASSVATSRPGAPLPAEPIGNDLALASVAAPARQHRGRARLVVAGAVALALVVLSALFVVRPLLDGTGAPGGPAEAVGTPGRLADGATMVPTVAVPPTTVSQSAAATSAPLDATRDSAPIVAPTLPPTAAPSTATPIPSTATPAPAQRLAAAEEALRQGESGRAIELLLAIKTADPATTGLADALYRAYLAHGMTLLEAGDFDGSWGMYGRALELRPESTAPREGQNDVILAKRWLEMEAAWGKDDDAATAAAEAIFQINPDYREVRQKLYALLIARADRLLSTSDRDGAYRALMRALEVRPDGAEARDRLRTYTPTPVPPTATPVRFVPSAPAQSAPAQSAPAQSAPAPAQSAPAQSAPAQSAPAPAQSAPSQPASAPSQPTPSGGAPVRR